MKFTVDHPQLEGDPNAMRLGLKRFGIHKNHNSPDFPVDSRSRSQNSKYSSGLPEGSREVQDLKQRLMDMNRELEDLRAKSSILKTEVTSPSHNRSPPVYRYEPPQSSTQKFIPTERNYNPMLDQFNKHPLFQQPKFTRSNPKVNLINPITGMNTRMGDYGNFIMRSNS